jgi:hypothetical protein
MAYVVAALFPSPEAMATESVVRVGLLTTGARGVATSVVPEADGPAAVTEPVLFLAVTEKL